MKHVTEAAQHQRHNCRKSPGLPSLSLGLHNGLRKVHD